MHCDDSTTTTADMPPQSPAIGRRFPSGSSAAKYASRLFLPPPMPPGISPAVTMPSMFPWRVPWYKTNCFASPHDSNPISCGPRRAPPPALECHDRDHIARKSRMHSSGTREVRLGTCNCRPEYLESRFVRGSFEVLEDRWRFVLLVPMLVSGPFHGLDPDGSILKPQHRHRMTQQPRQFDAERSVPGLAVRVVAQCDPSPALVARWRPDVRVPLGQFLDIVFCGSRCGPVGAARRFLGTRRRAFAFVRGLFLDGF